MKSHPFSAHRLHQLRNGIPIADVIGTDQRGFACPNCAARDTNINYHKNLARCFSCHKNFNPIDWVIASHKISFPQAVKMLEKQLAHNLEKPVINNFSEPSSQKIRKSQPTPIGQIIAPLLENLAHAKIPVNQCQNCKQLAARLSIAERKLARIKAILTAVESKT